MAAARGGSGSSGSSSMRAPEGKAPLTPAAAALQARSAALRASAAAILRSSDVAAAAAAAARTFGLRLRYHWEDTDDESARALCHYAVDALLVRLTATTWCAWRDADTQHIVVARAGGMPHVRHCGSLALTGAVLEATEPLVDAAAYAAATAHAPLTALRDAYWMAAASTARAEAFASNLARVLAVAPTAQEPLAVSALPCATAATAVWRIVLPPAAVLRAVTLQWRGAAAPPATLELTVDGAPVAVLARCSGGSGAPLHFVFEGAGLFTTARAPHAVHLRVSTALAREDDGAAAAAEEEEEEEQEQEQEQEVRQEGVAPTAVGTVVRADVPRVAARVAEARSLPYMQVACVRGVPFVIAQSHV